MLSVIQHQVNAAHFGEKNKQDYPRGGSVSDGRPYEHAPHEDGAIEHWDFDDERLDGSRIWDIDENGNIWPFQREFSDRRQDAPSRR